MKFIARNFRTNAIATALFNAAVEGAVGGSATPEVKVTLTRAEKQAKQVTLLTERIAADTTKLAELKNEIETGERLSSVDVGSAVVIRIGRGDTSKEVAARILGVKDDEANGSRRYKAAYGEGFDADTVIIQPSQIVSVIVEGGAPAEAANDVATTEVGRDEFDRPVNVYGAVIEVAA